MSSVLRWLFATLALASAHPAVPQAYPSQPIRLIAPFPPGGSVDIMARLIADPLAAQLGGRIVIDNRSGASGNIGMEAAARANPDGYTLVLNTIPLVTNQSLFDKLTWDPIRDFAHIGMVATAPHVLVVPRRVPATSVAELLRLARESPGKLSYASAGIGTTFHFCAEMFKDSTGTFILHVPYRGGGPALVDTLSGQVDMSFPTLSAALPHIKAGTLRPIALGAKERAPTAPDVPTTAEVGMPDLLIENWYGMVAPAATPPAIVATLNRVANEAMSDPSVKEKMADQGLTLAGDSPEHFRGFIDSETKKWANVIKEAGVETNK